MFSAVGEACAKADSLDVRGQWVLQPAREACWGHPPAQKRQALMASSAAPPVLIGRRPGLPEGTPVEPSPVRHPQPDSPITVAVTDSAPKCSPPLPSCSARRFGAGLALRERVNCHRLAPSASAVRAVRAVHAIQRCSQAVAVETACITVLRGGRRTAHRLGLLSTALIRKHSTHSLRPRYLLGHHGKITPWHRRACPPAVSP